MFTYTVPKAGFVVTVGSLEPVVAELIPVKLAPLIAGSVPAKLEELIPFANCASAIELFATAPVTVPVKEKLSDNFNCVALIFENAIYLFLLYDFQPIETA